MRLSHFAYADTLRVVAIVAVVCCHVLFIGSGGAYSELAGQLGGWGVDCFFVLSGYLLGRSYLEALMGLRSMPSIKLFWIRRFFRIWPLYAVAIIVSAGMKAIHGVHSVSIYDVLAHLLFLQNFVPAYESAIWNQPLWTMAIDAQFYALLPLLAVVIYPLCMRLQGSARNSAIGSILVVSLVLTLAWRFISLTYVESHHLDADTTKAQASILLDNVLGMGSIFIVGIGLAFVEKLAKRPPNRLLGYTVFALGLLVYPVFHLAFRGLTAGIAEGFAGAISAAMLLWGASAAKNTVFAQFSNSRALITGATLAYAIYLFHDPINFAIFSTLTSHHVTGPVRMLLLGILTFTVTTAVGYVAHRFVEKPALDAKERAREISDSATLVSSPKPVKALG